MEYNITFFVLQRIQGFLQTEDYKICPKNGKRLKIKMDSILLNKDNSFIKKIAFYLHIIKTVTFLLT